MINRIKRRIKRQLDSRSLPDVIKAVRADSLTYLEEAALNDLYRHVKNIERSGQDGIIIEAGCALGGSAIVIAAAKQKQRPFFVYDVFGMIPPPSEHDGEDIHERYQVIRQGDSEGIAGNKYYGYEEGLLDKVKENFRKQGFPVEENSVHLVQGLFEDTMHIETPVALAHLDGDWYSSVITCLRQIEPHLISGGILVIDDYEHWSGCRKAVDEYFADKQDQYKFDKKSRLHIIRK